MSETFNKKFSVLLVIQFKMIEVLAKNEWKTINLIVRFFCSYLTGSALI